MKYVIMSNDDFVEIFMAIFDNHVPIKQKNIKM